MSGIGGNLQHENDHPLSRYLLVRIAIGCVD